LNHVVPLRSGARAIAAINRGSSASAHEVGFPHYTTYEIVGTRGFEIGDFRRHPRAGALDQEVDLMTRLHPEERPTNAGEHLVIDWGEESALRLRVISVASDGVSLDPRGNWG
jgi:hypothetical protein